MSQLTLTIEQTGKSRNLSPEEAGQLNRWLATHTRHWAPLTSPAPSTGDVVIKGVNPDGGAFELALWTGVSGADWNNTAITRVNPKGRLKVQSFSDEDWTVLRHLVDGQGFEKTDVLKAGIERQLEPARIVSTEGQVMTCPRLMVNAIVWSIAQFP
ncbi:hypothetical protein [Asaia prunellae]|uniref:hypothetical protein n=1 Tax=Asaia prunellae TaxID=610245 RepID=UPI000A6F4D0A|nr:hypothetical protein [Asaia prunellae]